MPLKARDLDDKWSLARASARLLRAIRASSEWAGTLVKFFRRSVREQKGVDNTLMAEEILIAIEIQRKRLLGGVPKPIVQHIIRSGTEEDRIMDQCERITSEEGAVRKVRPIISSEEFKVESSGGESKIW
ncbi:1097_t:CDS:2 [Rhizophagus irregularis]|nr:1097_t:CDS:2 [Rhizophagus irregularis]